MKTKALFLFLLLSLPMVWAESSRWTEIYFPPKGKIYFDTRTIEQVYNGHKAWVKAETGEPFQVEINCKARRINNIAVVPDSGWENFYYHFCNPEFEVKPPTPQKPEITNYDKKPLTVVVGKHGVYRF